MAWQFGRSLGTSLDSLRVHFQEQLRSYRSLQIPGMHHPNRLKHIQQIPGEPMLIYIQRMIHEKQSHSRRIRLQILLLRTSGHDCF